MATEQPEHGVKLPPPPPPGLIEDIAEASKNTRKIYLLYMGFLAYCALAVVRTLYRAELDPELEDRLKQNLPHLFENPKPKK